MTPLVIYVVVCVAVSAFGAVAGVKLANLAHRYGTGMVDSQIKRSNRAAGVGRGGQG